MLTIENANILAMQCKIVVKLKLCIISILGLFSKYLFLFVCIFRLPAAAGSLIFKPVFLSYPVVRQSSCIHQAVVRQSSSSRRAVVRQSSGSRQAVVVSLVFQLFRLEFRSEKQMAWEIFKNQMTSAKLYYLIKGFITLFIYWI